MKVTYRVEMLYEGKPAGQEDVDICVLKSAMAEMVRGEEGKLVIVGWSLVVDGEVVIKNEPSAEELLNTMILLSRKSLELTHENTRLRQANEDLMAVIQTADRIMDEVRQDIAGIARITQLPAS